MAKAFGSYSPCVFLSVNWTETIQLFTDPNSTSPMDITGFAVRAQLRPTNTPLIDPITGIPAPVLELTTPSFYMSPPAYPVLPAFTIIDAPNGIIGLEVNADDIIANVSATSAPQFLFWGSGARQHRHERHRARHSRRSPLQTGHDDSAVGHMTTIKVPGTGRVQIVLKPETVQRLNQIRPVNVDRKQNTTNVAPQQRNVSATQDVRPVTVESAGRGPPGPPGPPGPDGGTVPAISFSYGDASPDTVYTCPNNATLAQTSIVIDTPFNGVGATLKLSVGATTVLDTFEVDPTKVAEYQSAPALTVTPGQQIILTIVPGSGATAGAGRIFLEFT